MKTTNKNKYEENKRTRANEGALEEQARAYGNYLEVIDRIWDREFDALTELIYRGDSENEIYERILRISKDGLEIIANRIDTIEKYSNPNVIRVMDNDDTASVKILAATLKNMIASALRDQKLQTLGI